MTLTFTYNEDPRSVAVRKCFVHPHRRDQVARQSMSWCQITPSRPIDIEPALQNPPCPSTQHIARGVTVTRDQYQSTLSHPSFFNNKLTRDSVVVKWYAEGESCNFDAGTRQRRPRSRACWRKAVVAAATPGRVNMAEHKV